MFRKQHLPAVKRRLGAEVSKQGLKAELDGMWLKADLGERAEFEAKAAADKARYDREVADENSSRLTQGTGSSKRARVEEEEGEEEPATSSSQGEKRPFPADEMEDDAAEPSSAPFGGIPKKKKA